MRPFRFFALSRFDLIAFISGAAVMVLELVGSRLLAPYVGTSLPVWTALIGMILASLSVGYAIGGRAADAHPEPSGLAWILGFASITLLGIAAFTDVVLAWILNFIPDLRAAAVIASALLFSVPSILFGMITPYMVRLKFEAPEKVGKTTGNLYALSTVGSIAGTFASGFFLIPYFGSRTLIIILGFCVACLISLIDPRRYWKITAGLCSLAVLAYLAVTAFSAIAAGAGFVELDTGYNHVRIIKMEDAATGRPITVLQMGTETHSASFEDSDEPVFPYIRFYRLIRHLNPETQRALMIGGGAFTYPRDYAAMFPEATMDIVEIDPALPKLAEQYFRFSPSPRLRTIAEDGRTFVNRDHEPYDAIFIDAFSSYNIPFHLTTREAVERFSHLLAPEGAVLMNIISPLEGPETRLLSAIHATYRAVFPYVYLFQVEPHSPRSPQNLMLVAMGKEIPPARLDTSLEISDMLALLYKRDLESEVPPLTDDFAPVEQYAAEITSLRRRSPF